MLDAAREPKPELAKAEADVCGFPLRPLPNVGFGKDAGDFLVVSESTDGLVVSAGSLAVISCVCGG